MIHNVSLTAFEVIGMISRFIFGLLRNFVSLFIFFVFAYYILIKVFGIREDEQ